MSKIQRSALVPYTANAMFEIVNDVASYPEFLPWCGGSVVHLQNEREMEASVLIKIVGLTQWFKTRNQIETGKSITMQLIDGPFETLQGEWQFIALGEEGCKVELNLEFEIKQGLKAAVLKTAFGSIANSMVDSFCQRAGSIHG